MRTRIEFEHYLNALAEWAADEDETTGNRSEAVSRIEPWIDRSKNDEDEILDLSRLELTSLPKLLDQVRYLDVSNNKLSELPEVLPTDLINFCATDNQLTHLPITLSNRLEYINVSNNRLTYLPPLPTSLTTLDISNNLLLSLPEFPPNIQHINIARNQLYISMLELPANTEIIGEGNIIYRPLTDSIAAWIANDAQNTVVTTWGNFRHEAGAEEFSLFLDKLRSTVNFKNENFRNAVVAWLHQLTVDPSLRKETFLSSVGATESCENRVSLTFNEMKKISMETAVKNGAYDKRIEELIRFARGMFRLNELEKIARDKFTSLATQLTQRSANTYGETRSEPDEIELFLEYQIKLHKALKLPLATEEKIYFGGAYSYLKEFDVIETETHIKANENKYFLNFLTTSWEPWRFVLKRNVPDAFELCQDNIQNEVDAVNLKLQEKIQELQESNPLEYEENAKGLLTTFADEKNKITSIHMHELTKKMLSEHGVSHSALDAIWTTRSPEISRSSKRQRMNQNTFRS